MALEPRRELANSCAQNDRRFTKANIFPEVLSYFSFSSLLQNVVHPQMGKVGTRNWINTLFAASFINITGKTDSSLPSNGSILLHYSSVKVKHVSSVSHTQ